MSNQTDIQSLAESRIEEFAGSARFALKAALIASAVAAALAVIALFGSRILSPNERMYRNAIEFTFEGSQTGRYPSGQPFTNSDVIASQILLNVFRNLKLEQYGVDENEFLGSVSISAASPVEDQITSGYIDRLENRALTLTERKSIEDEMAARLTEVARRRVIINYTVSSIRAVPDAIGMEVVAAIPNEWARNAIGSKRAFKVLNSPSSKVMERELSDANTNPELGLVLQVLTMSRLQLAIGDIQNSSGFVASIVDPQTGASVDDAAAKLGFVRSVLLPGVLRAAAQDAQQGGLNQYRDAFTDMIASMKLDLKVVNEQITTIRGLIEKFDKDKQGGPAVSGPANLTADVIVQPGGSADASLGQLLNMKLEDQRFTLVRSLTNDLLPLERSKAGMEGSIGRVEKYMEFLLSPATLAGATSSAGPASRDIIKKNLVESAGVIERIVEVTNRELVLKEGNLYSSLALPKPIVTVHAWFAPANLALAIAFVAIMGAGVFLLVFAFSRQLKR